MPQDRRVLGYLGLALSLVCCLPVFCLSGLVVLAGSVTALSSTQWSNLDTATAVIFGAVCALAALAGLILAGLSLWSILSVRPTLAEE
jgi:hypothetical protein